MFRRSARRSVSIAPRLQGQEVLPFAHVEQMDWRFFAGFLKYCKEVLSFARLGQMDLTFSGGFLKYCQEVEGQMKGSRRLRKFVPLWHSRLCRHCEMWVDGR